MKIIDLLNKIANGEEVPKKIKWNGVIFDYVEEETYEDYINLNNCSLFEHLGDENEIYKVTNMLNDEVEIIEEEKKIPEKLEYIVTDENGEFSINGFTFDYEQKMQIIDTLNQVIDYLQSKGE